MHQLSCHSNACILVRNMCKKCERKLLQMYHPKKISISVMARKYLLVAAMQLHFKTYVNAFVFIFPFFFPISCFSTQSMLLLTCVCNYELCEHSNISEMECKRYPYLPNFPMHFRYFPYSPSVCAPTHSKPKFQFAINFL